jgi:PE-PPE domain/PE family
MTYVLTQPQVMVTAAADLAGLGSAISEANAAATGQTTGVLAAAGDEVSAAAATLFNAYAQEYQAVMQQVATFHAEFTQALAAAGNAYAETEAAVTAPLRALPPSLPTSSTATSTASGSGVATAIAKAAASPPFTFPSDYTTVFISGSGIGLPSPAYMTTVFKTYVQPNFPSVNLNALPLFTPAGLYPLTGTKVLTLDESVAQGVSFLNNTLFGTGVGQHGLIQPGGTPVIVQGISQGAIIASLEMQKLLATSNPVTASQLGFVLLGDPMNPNGGLLERFAGLTLPSLGQTFYGATPSNTVWPTHIYSLEYDGIADWPQYPIDIFSDLNAFAGFYYVHGMYPGLDPAALPPGYNMVTLPTSPSYTGNTTYSMITIPHLPMLEPVRSIPLIGNPIADLVEPDLRVLVNIGYGNPAYGYSTGPADVPTPFGLFPPVDPHTVLTDLVTGTQQGISAAGSDLSTISLSDISKVLTPNPLPALSAVTTAISSGSVIDNFVAATAKVQPTIDIATALLTAVPSYDVGLFMGGISQMANGAPVQGLMNAIGMPIAADVGLTTLLAGYEVFVLTGAWYPPPTPL